MAYLADTNVALRWTQPLNPDYPIARAAVSTLRQRGEDVFLTPQNLIEFWNVATRPADRNGLGLTIAQADKEAQRLEQFFPFLLDTPGIYTEWRQLVLSVGVSGVQVHDARLVAVMRAHGVTHILTFNTTDFTRYPGIVVVHPRDIINVP
jgi:predicted nucleic acid-binding protein